jgi:hypothetical protein
MTAGADCPMLPDIEFHDSTEPQMHTTTDTHPTFRHLRRKAAALGLVGASVALMPAAALASSPSSINRNQNVNVKAMALAKGHTVKTQVNVQNPERQVSNWWSQPTVARIVQKGVNGGYQRPYQSQGFRCTPVVKGETTSFTCKLRGADVPTIVTLKFNVVYRGDTASG